MSIMGFDKNLWLLILNSDAIVKVNVISPLKETDLKPKDYLKFDAKVLDIYRGIDLPEVIPIRHYIYPETKFPLKKMMSGEIVMFLVDLRHDQYSQCFYFLNNIQEPSFDEFNTNFANKLKAELQFQEKIIKDFGKTAENIPLEKEVTALIEEMIDPNKAQHAYKKLEELGKNAVPAIIKHMDDRRELALKHIQLENKSKNAWEAFRHYGPQQVIDVLAAILNQITGDYFGDIHNGGKDDLRTKVYHGWIVWLAKNK